MAQIRVGKGRSAVMIDGDLADGLLRDLEAAIGPVVDEIRREAEAIKEGIDAEWPVKSGVSRGSWEIVPTLMPSQFTFQFSLVSSVPYTPYIRSTRHSADEKGTVRQYRPLDVLVRKPAAEAKVRLKKELPGILAKHLGGGQ